MNIPISLPNPKRIVYPESDGQPMAENTLQFQWIVTIQGGLDAEFRDDPNVFVAGDLLWYPVEGRPEICLAPDAFVAFGRPKGHRGSYQQWLENNLPPQVVFEVLSPSNRGVELLRKFLFYEHYGVEEYYIYDPDDGSLAGWLRTKEGLEEIAQMDGWGSPRLGIRFSLSSGELQLFGRDGRRFATYLELAGERDEAQKARDEAQKARDEAQKARDEAQREGDEARARAQRLAARLRELGHDPEP
jgi:Uma2 family endonuclease